MSTISRKKKIYCKELYDEMKNINNNYFKVGEDFLNSKLKIKIEETKSDDDKIERKLFSLNKKCFDFDFNAEKEDIFIDGIGLNSQNKLNLIKSIIEDEEKKSINNYIKIEKEKNEKNSKDKLTEEEKEKLEDERRIFEIFGEGQSSFDEDEIQSEPNLKTIEVSDIELEEEEEEIEENEENDKVQENKIPVENNIQFTEYILSQLKSPIEMLTIGKKIYELINRKEEESKKEMDLTPLNTYKKNNNEINIQLFKSINMNGQYQQFKQNGNIKLDDYKSSEQTEEVPTTMILDNRDYKSNCSIWFGTNKAKLIRIPICSKPSKDCQGMVIDSQETGITCLDIFENFLIMGHVDGTIQILENQKIIEKIKDIKNEIIQIKFLKINSKKKKFEFIYSDSNGAVTYIRRHKVYLVSRNASEQIASNKEFPVYKICIFSKEKDLTTIKKKNIIIALASLKNVSLYKKRAKTEIGCIAIIEIPYGNAGDFVLDCDFGYGFAPIPQINSLIEKEKKGEISLIDNALIEENQKEKLLLVVSYHVVIRLFEIILNEDYSFNNIIEIGYYITEKPVCKMGFIFNSYISIIDLKKNLQIINTFIFETGEYKGQDSLTSNNIIHYNNCDLSGLDILMQNNIFFNNLSDGKRIGANINFLGSSIIFEQNIFIVSKQKFFLYKLNRWDEIINEFCQNEEYYKMIWLSAFVFGKNRKLFEIESKEIEEIEHSLQESIYIFLLKGLSEENKYKELNMLIEYSLSSGRIKDLYFTKDIFVKRKIENYLFDYVSEYILNGYFNELIFDTNFLEEYINYYLKKNETLYLTKILFKINENNLNKPEISKILEDNNILNPYIYAKINDQDDNNKKDHFKPIESLFKLYERKIKEEKIIEEKDNNKTDKVIKEEYFKLITEHDMKYFNDKTFKCNDYIGHKLFWYINKCLEKKEFPRLNILPNDIYATLCKKILLFLTLENVMEILLKFDSFSYFQILTKIFIEPKISKIMNTDIEKKQFPFLGLESFVKKYHSNISIEYLSKKYFYYQIKLFVDEKTRNFNNYFYIKYDFYQMTSLICIENKYSMIILDRVTIIDAIKFFINYRNLLEGEKSKNYFDPFNSHKLPDKKDLFKKFSENIEKNISTLLKSLLSYQDFFENDLDEIFQLEGLKNHNKLSVYLYEYGRKYNELFEIKLEEYRNKNPKISKEDSLNEFFNWINDTLKLTSQLDKKKSNKNYHSNFKNNLKTHFPILLEISVEYLYNLIEKWFNEDLKDICFSLNSNELKCAYLDKYLSVQNSQEQKDKDYDDYLMMRLELSIKYNNKEDILKMAETNRYLWDNKFLQYFIKNEVYDAAIFISQKRDNIENCIKLTAAQINKIFDKIKKILLGHINNIAIIIRLDEIKKYLDLGLNSCASWTEKNKNYNISEVKNTWLIPLDLINGFKNEINKMIKENDSKKMNKSEELDITLKKIEQNLLENIEYILSRMNDYIPLSFIVDVLCDKFKDSKFKDYSKMFQRMFVSTRRIEDIFRAVYNLWSDSVSNASKIYLGEIKKGLYSDVSECNYCKIPINENIGLESAIYFNCGHSYHTLCCPIEKGKYACYICRMNDLEESMYTNIPNLVFRKKENVIKNETDKNKKKSIEKIKKDNKRSKLLDKLKKINKKKYDKLEHFKSNVENIDIKI